MKPIQIMIDEELLAALDADGEVVRLGRSAVFRMIVAEYLHRRRQNTIRDAYEKAYGGKEKRVEDELKGWAAEGVWPGD